MLTNAFKCSSNSVILLFESCLQIVLDDIQRDYFSVNDCNTAIIDVAWGIIVVSLTSVA